MYIGGDSGPLHLAATTRVPIVAIFGPTPSERSAPWRDSAFLSESIEIDGLPCRPCDQRVCVPGDFRCLTHIDAPRVIAAAERLLAARQGVVSRPRRTPGDSSDRRRADPLRRAGLRTERAAAPRGGGRAADPPGVRPAGQRNRPADGSARPLPMVRQLDYDRSADSGDRPRVAGSARRPVPSEPRGASTAGGRCGGRRRARRFGHDGAARPRRRWPIGWPPARSSCITGSTRWRRRPGKAIGRSRTRLSGGHGRGLRRTRRRRCGTRAWSRARGGTRGIFDRTLAVFDEIRPVTRYFAVDQLACSIVLAAYAPIEEAAPWFDHYWANRPWFNRAIERFLSRALLEGLTPLDAGDRLKKQPIVGPLDGRAPWWLARLRRIISPAVPDDDDIPESRLIADAGTLSKRGPRAATRRARRPRADGRRGPVLDRHRRDLSRHFRWPPGS